MRYVLLTIAVTLLPACSLTLPVRGSIQNSDEAFTGTATGYLDGGGDLTIAVKAIWGDAASG